MLVVHVRTGQADKQKQKLRRTESSSKSSTREPRRPSLSYQDNRQLAVCLCRQSVVVYGHRGPSAMRCDQFDISTVLVIVSGGPMDTGFLSEVILKPVCLSQCREVVPLGRPVIHVCAGILLPDEQ